MGADVAVAEKPVKLRETERTDSKVRLLRSEIPWLPEEYYEAHLVKMRVGSHNFLFGSAIRSKPLIAAANQLDAHRSEICNKLLYSHLPQFTEGYHPKVRLVKNHRSKQPIFEIDNNGGQRVFFIRFNNLDNMQVIVRIAVCDKAMEDEVLSVITTDSRKFIKKSARL